MNAPRRRHVLSMAAMAPFCMVLLSVLLWAPTWICPVEVTAIPVVREDEITEIRPSSHAEEEHGSPVVPFNSPLQHLSLMDLPGSALLIMADYLGPRAFAWTKSVNGHLKGLLDWKQMQVKDEMLMRQRLQFAPHVAHEWYQLAVQIILQEDHRVKYVDGTAYRVDPQGLERMKFVLQNVLPGGLGTIDVNRLVLMAFEVRWPEAMNLIIELAGGEVVLLPEVLAMINNPVEDPRQGIELLPKEQNEFLMRQRLQFAPHVAHQWYKIAAQIILRVKFTVESDGTAYRSFSQPTLDRLKTALQHVLPGGLSTIDLNRLVLLAFEVRWPEAMNLIIELAGGNEVLLEEVRVMINDPVEYHRRGIEFLAKINHLAGLDVDKLMEDNAAERTELVRISDLLIKQDENSDLLLHQFEMMKQFSYTDRMRLYRRYRDRLCTDELAPLLDYEILADGQLRLILKHARFHSIQILSQQTQNVRMLNFLDNLENELMINYARTGFGALTVVIKKSGNEALVRELLRAGAEPLLRDNEGGFTPLHYAAEKTVGVIYDLLNAGVPVDVRGWSEHQGTPLFCAAKQEKRSAIAILLKAGANPVFAIHAALNGGHFNLADFIMDNYNWNDKYDKRLLIQLQSLACSSISFNYGIDEPPRYFIAVLKILKRNKMLDKEIHPECDPDLRGTTLFMYFNGMCKYKHAQAIREVEEGRIDTFPTPSTIAPEAVEINENSVLNAIHQLRATEHPNDGIGEIEESESQNSIVTARIDTFPTPSTIATEANKTNNIVLRAIRRFRGKGSTNENRKRGFGIFARFTRKNYGGPQAYSQFHTFPVEDTTA